MAKIEWTPERRAEASRLAKERQAAAQADPAPKAPVVLAEEVRRLVEPAPVMETAPAGADLYAARLSDDELSTIADEARKKVDAEIADVAKLNRKELMAKALDNEILRQRREAGLTDYRDDMITFLIDVAPFANDIRIDGKVYTHGQWVTLPRRQYDAIREIMARSWDSEDRAGNPNRKHARTVAGSMNPLQNEQRMPDGTFTVGLDQRVHGKTGLASVGVL